MTVSQHSFHNSIVDCRDAEIASLRAELAERTRMIDELSYALATARQDAEDKVRLKEALEPFAGMAGWYENDYVDNDVALWQSRYSVSVQLKVGDFRKARALWRTTIKKWLAP